MQTLNDALYALYMSKEIALDEALRVTNSQEEFNRMIGKDPESEEKKPLATQRPLTGGLGKR
jgi:Tfp pilus assembly ATPase PilU